MGLVVIGASWGGLTALRAVLRALPAGFPAAVVVVQHRSPREGMLAALLADGGALDVREAEDKDELRGGAVLVGPPGYHLLIEGDTVSLNVDEPVRDSRPSIDVLFESAAVARGARAAGVVLTGANDDGAAGLAAIRRRGGIAVVQDPDGAERSEMPAAALAACPDALVLALERIGPRLASICGVRR